MLKRNSFHIVCCLILTICSRDTFGQPIDRKAVVQRHNVVVTSADSLSSLTVGNGKFAFTVDVTGLQSFPDNYASGIPLGTLSEWGWHSFPNKSNYKFASSLKTYHFNGRDILYAVQWNEAGPNKEAADWFRQNPHRLQLGNIGLEIKNENGEQIKIEDVKNIRQELDVFTGEIQSRFTIDDIPVEVITCCHPQLDAIGVKVTSKLLGMGRIKIRIRYPYPTGQWTDVGNNRGEADRHVSLFSKTNYGGTIHRILDSTEYWTDLVWSGDANMQEKEKNYFLLTPSASSDSFELVARFSPSDEIQIPPAFAETRSANRQGWNNFWEQGGAIDFSGSTDERAFELERRIILSQ